jgi:hypothetical protein
VSVLTNFSAGLLIGTAAKEVGKKCQTQSKLLIRLGLKSALSESVFGFIWYIDKATFILKIHFIKDLAKYF